MIKKILAVAVILSIMPGFAGADDPPKEFSYVDKLSGANGLSINAFCEFLGGSTDICPVTWPTLTHGALLGSNNWHVFVNPLSATGFADIVAAPVPTSFDAPDDYQPFYLDFTGKWVIGQIERPGNPALTFNLPGEFGIAAVESSDPNTFTVAAPRVVSTLPDIPRYQLNHPLLNGNPGAKLSLSLQGVSTTQPANFCGKVFYDVPSAQWYLTSACYSLAGSTAGWGPVNVAIKVTPVGGNAFGHVVSPESRRTLFCRARAQCSLIDNPLINNRPDLVLIGTRGTGANASKINFRYNGLFQRWQLECIPYYSGFGSATATHDCNLQDGAEYHIWAPNADQSAFTSSVSPRTGEVDIEVPAASTTTVPRYMQQLVATPYAGPSNHSQSILSYSPGSTNWHLSLLDFSSSVASDSAYAVHAFPPAQNAYLHKVTAQNRSVSFYSVIDHPLLNGRDKYFVVQSVFNPFGMAMDLGAATPNEHVGLYWTGSNWSVALENSVSGSPLVIGSYYQVLMAGRYQSEGETLAINPRAFRQVGNVSNLAGQCTMIDHALSNNNPSARIFFSHVIRDTSSDPAQAINTSFSSKYDDVSHRWKICRDDMMLMPLNAKFNVIIYQNQNDPIPVVPTVDPIFSNSFE